MNITTRTIRNTALAAVLLLLLAGIALMRIARTSRVSESTAADVVQTASPEPARKQTTTSTVPVVVPKQDASVPSSSGSVSTREKPVTAGAGQTASLLVSAPDKKSPTPGVIVAMQPSVTNAPAAPPVNSPSAAGPAKTQSPAAPPVKAAPVAAAAGFIVPTPEQIRDQPASKTAAQVLTQKLNLDDPATRAELDRVLKTSAETRKKAAWEKAAKLGLPTEGDTPGGGRFVLQDFEGDRPVYHQSENVNAAISTAADKVRYFDPLYYVDGSGDEIGMWEIRAPLLTHQEFMTSGFSRITPAPGQSNVVSPHATHVACTLIGSGITTVNGLSNALRGMAPAATIKAYDDTNDAGEMALAGATQSNQFGRLLVSNHSYGIDLGWSSDLAGNVIWLGPYTPDANPSDDFESRFGQYSDKCSIVDGLLWNTPYYLPFFSAGNERTDTPPNSGNLWYWLNTSGTPGAYVIGRDPRGDGEYKNGFDTLSGGAKVSKNTLTVGALDDAVTHGSHNSAAAAMTAFSSWGPADDGRIKPDIVANGQDVLSASDTANNASAIKSGTSMASPNACGSALLLQQIYRNHTGETMRSDKLKALIIHTADDLGKPGPDYKTGWGLMNTRRAADAIEGTTSTQILEGLNSASQQSEYFNATVTSGKALRVTLCWTDPAGTEDTTHDDHAPDLVNDLDLVVTSPSGVTYHPYIMPYVGQWTKVSLDQPATFGPNHTDNVEQVYLPTPVAGAYLVTVTRTGPIAAPGYQDYALIIGTEPPPDIDVQPTVVNFDCVCCGAASEPIPVTIRNTGSGKLTGIVVSIDGAGASSFVLTQPAATVLNAGDSTTVTVTYNAPATGTSAATLRIASDDPDENLVSIPLGASPYSSTVTLSGTKPLAAPANPYNYADSIATKEGRLIVATSSFHEIDEFGFLLYAPTTLHVAAYDSSFTSGVAWQKTIQPVAGQSTTGVRLTTNAAGTEVVMQRFLVIRDPGALLNATHWSTVVTAYDNSGNQKWEHSDPWYGYFGYAGAVGYGVVVDHQGAVIVGRCELTQYSQRKLRLTKCLANGASEWNIEMDTASIGTSNVSPKASHIAVDANNDIFVSAEGPDIPGYRGAYVSKFLGITGSQDWYRLLLGPNGEEVVPYAGVVVNATGDVVIGGYYVTGVGGGIRHHKFVVKLNGTNGTTLWTSAGPANEDDYMTQIALDSRGDVVTTGLGGTGWVTRKLAGADGALLWQKEFATGAGEPTLAVDPSGHVIVAGPGGGTSSGTSNKQIYRFKKYAALTGNLLWEACHDHTNFNSGYYPNSYFALEMGFQAGALSSDLHVVAGPETWFRYNAPWGNKSPNISVNHEPLTVNEGGGASNEGSIFDDDGAGDTLTLTATRNGTPFGVLTRNEAALKWNWTLATSDGPDQGGIVNLTAADGISLPATKTFTLIVNNVPPGFATGGDITLTPAEAILFSRAITFTDPGTDVWTATVNYGDGGGNQPVTVNQAQKSLALSHPYIGAGPYTVSVTISDGDPGGSTTHSFIVTIGAARTISDWRLLHFGTTENTGDAADLADKDGDGIPNLAEFAFNLDPGKGDPSALPQPSFGSGGGNFAQLNGEPSPNLGPGDSMTFSFAEPPGTTGVTYGAESSTNLTSWQPVTDSGSGGTHTFSVPIGTNAKLFMRLRVTTVP